MIRRKKHRLSTPPPDRELVLADHLKELKRRLAWPFLAFIGASIACYLVYDKVFAVLQAPLHEPLYFTSPQGGFNVTMGICLAAGLIVAIPLLVYQIVMFLRPAFPRVITRRATVCFALISSVLAAGGVTFALGIVVPLVLRFFTGFQTEGLSALITASSYFDLLTKLCMTFALIFQLPLILGGANRIKPLSPRRLFRFERYVIVGSVGIGVLVPFAFDLTTQALIALPIVILYNMSILVVVVDNHVRRARYSSGPVVVPRSPSRDSSSVSSSPQRRVVRGTQRTSEGKRISDFVK